MEWSNKIFARIRLDWLTRRPKTITGLLSFRIMSGYQYLREWFSVKQFNNNPLEQQPPDRIFRLFSNYLLVFLYIFSDIFETRVTERGHAGDIPEMLSGGGYMIKYLVVNTSNFFPLHINFVYIRNGFLFNFLFTPISGIKFYHERLPMFCWSVSLLNGSTIILSATKIHTESLDNEMNAFQLSSGFFSISFAISLKRESLKEDMFAIYLKCSAQADIFVVSLVWFTSAFFSGTWVSKDLPRVLWLFVPNGARWGSRFLTLLFDGTNSGCTCVFTADFTIGPEVDPWEI